MSPFVFQAVQTLDIGASDNPNIDVQGGKLILTATRNGDQIRITAPLNSVIPTVEATPIATTSDIATHPQRRRRRRSYNAAHHVPRGEKSPLAKLKESDVREMRALAKDPSYRNSYSSEHAMMRDLANTYKVHLTTTYSVIRGTTWKHVEV
jgi:hypothetical protein